MLTQCLYIASLIYYTSIDNFENLGVSSNCTFLPLTTSNESVDIATFVNLIAFRALNEFSDLEIS
jgi:hypothetical protein